MHPHYPLEAERDEIGADGEQAILDEYEGLMLEDIRACLLFSGQGL